MRRLWIFLLVVMALPSCEEEVVEASFRIKTEGFILDEALLESAVQFPTFNHKISGGTVTFSGQNGVYTFVNPRVSIEDYIFRIPVGEYQVEFTIPEASLYGQKGGSFITDPINVVVTEMTESLTVEVKANCSMFLVKDEMNQLDEGIYLIEKHSYAHGYFKSYPLHMDSLSGLYYTYFTPDTVPDDPSAFLWFYEGKPGMVEGGLATKDFEIGYQYNIAILE